MQYILVFIIGALVGMAITILRFYTFAVGDVYVEESDTPDLASVSFNFSKGVNTWLKHKMIMIFVKKRDSH